MENYHKIYWTVQTCKKYDIFLIRQHTFAAYFALKNYVQYSGSYYYYDLW
jgi:hypothetical protein